MFERYTERARRVIFFARYEASQFGSTTIETEHLLLGLIREDVGLANRFIRGTSPVSIRQEIERQSTIREKVSTSIDRPLSDECKRILAYSAEEAERLNQRHIGTEHLFLGILREGGCLAARILYERGMKVDEIRDSLARSPMPQEPESAGLMDRLFGRLFPRHSPALPEDGVVPDADTAKRIAEAVWTPLYGPEPIASQTPVNAELKHNV